MLASLPLLLLLQAAAPASDTVPGTGAPTFTIPRVEADATIDGLLDEPAWAQATRLVGFSRYQPVDGVRAEERTEVRVWYSPTALHVGIVAHDRTPEAIRATNADRDNIDQEDRVTLYLDTFGDRRRAFVFAVNALGVQQDGVRTEGGASAGSLFGGGTDLTPDYQWDSRGRRTPDGYVVEVRIPFRSLRFSSSGEQRWGFNATRHVQRSGHEDSWVDLLRGSASMVGQFAVMEGLRDLERGIVMEAQPFVTASSRGARLLPDERWERASLDTEVGANLRFGFANASIDATVNPDFSQVESDAGLVTANERFALFVSERRPFFVEGIELFATPNQLVYTRQMVSPTVGGKLTGKFGPWGVAYLSVHDDGAARGTPDALFNIARVRRDVGAGSIIGVTLTDRRASGDDYNTVLAADTRLVFGGKYYLVAQLGGSATRVDAAAPRRTGAVYRAELDRTGRSFGFNYSLNGIEDAFATRSGFVPRTGITAASGFNRLTWFGAPGGLVESVTAFFGPNYTWRYGQIASESPIEGSEFVNVTARLRRGWSVETSVRREFYDFHPEDYAGFQVLLPNDAVVPFVPAGEVRGLVTGSLEIDTPVFRTFSAGLELNAGQVPLFAEAGEGRRQRVSASLSARPTASLRSDREVVAERLTRARDDSEFARTIIPRARVEFQPTRALFFRLIGEYRAERRQPLRDPATGSLLVFGADPGTPLRALDANGLRLEWLASYEPTPGTVAFLGYAVDLVDRDALAFERLRRTGDGVFVKVAYQFRK